MNVSTKFSKCPMLFIAAAVFSTLMTGCNRQASSDQAAASTGPTTSASSDASRPSPGTVSSANSTSSTANSGSPGTTVASTAGAVGTAAASNADDAVAAANNAARIAAGGADATTRSSGAAAAGSGASGSSMPLSDAQIQGILMTSNTAEIDAGKLAQAKSKNAEVKEFASSMIKEHTTVNQQVATLEKKPARPRQIVTSRRV